MPAIRNTIKLIDDDDVFLLVNYRRHAHGYTGAPAAEELPEETRVSLLSLYRSRAPTAASLLRFCL